MNYLYYGDNLSVLREKIPSESVDLCYIDPPFNSKRNYFQIYNNIGEEDKAQAQAFIDTWTWDQLANEGYQEIITNFGGRFTSQLIELIRGLRLILKEGSLFAYLVSMSLRITEIHRILKETGSFYLHCDPTASHYLKLLLDAIFCPHGGSFRNEIVWEKTRVPKAQSQHFAKQQDVIFFYTKSSDYTFNYLYKQPDEHYIKKYFSQVEENSGRKYQLVSFLQDGQGQPKQFGERLISPPNGKHWIWSQEKINEAMQKGLLVFTHPDKPRLKKYLDEQLGKNLGTIWIDIPPINSQAKERLGYPTQKPEALLERIIKTSSNIGEVVLDAYCGCGTTVSVAQNLQRKWVGIDITYQSISLILRRLEQSFGKDILETIDIDGIPKDLRSVQALVEKKDDRLRKEFEKWAILTYSNNRAIINTKKGADKGIDGIAYFLTSKNETAKMVFQVKSGKVERKDIAALRGDMEREQAAMAILITLENPTKAMEEEARATGFYHHEMMGKQYQKIQIVTIEEMLTQDKRLEMPLSLEVLKKAELKQDNNQLEL
jgi:DNA modification methylase